MAFCKSLLCFLRHKIKFDLHGDSSRPSGNFSMKYAFNFHSAFPVSGRMIHPPVVYQNLLGFLSELLVGRRGLTQRDRGGWANPLGWPFVCKKCSHRSLRSQTRPLQRQNFFIKVAYSIYNICQVNISAFPSHIYENWNGSLSLREHSLKLNVILKNGVIGFHVICHFLVLDTNLSYKQASKNSLWTVL